MKGSTQVTVDRVVRSIQRYDEFNIAAKAILDKAITDYANLKRSTWFGKWRAGDKSDRKVAASYLGTFETWDDILFEVVSGEELQTISTYIWGSWDTQAEMLKALVQVADTGFIEAGPGLAKFIDNFTPKAQQ